MPETPVSPPKPPRQTVLVVDDEPLIANLVAHALRDEGYAVRVAADGVWALAAAADAPPDLLLSDVRMPRMNGVNLARELRERHPDLPVILFSAQYDGIDYPELGVRFLPKPFDLSALLAAVAEELAETREEQP
jgi:DNA-binding response OmpR family regulator